MRRDLEIRGYTVGQFPNPPLWAAFAGWLVSKLAAEGSALEDGSRAVFWVGLTIWAWLEASDGVNGFRRGLGVVALALIAVGLARELR